MTDPKTLHDLEMEVKLDQVQDMEKELANLEMGYSLFPITNFRNNGLPILEGLLDDTFNPTRWVDYVGHHHVGLKVANDALTEVVYDIPPLLGRLVSMLNDDPDEPSLNDESIRLGYIRDINPQGATAQIYNNAVEGLERAHPTEEQDLQRSAAACYAVLNKIFKDHNLGQLEVPEVLSGIKVENNKVTIVQEQPDYDIDDGEDF